MTGPRPGILVVDGSRRERTLIASVLSEAGFAVVAAAEEHSASAVLGGERFAAAVIALPSGGGIEFLHRARNRQPGLKGLVVVEPAAMRFVDEDFSTLVKRPIDPRRLLGCVFELVLREDDDAAAPHHNRVAEYGIAAAKLACLHNRHVAAAAAGASRLAQDLSRQIGETSAAHRILAAAMAVGGSAVMHREGY